MVTDLHAERQTRLCLPLPFPNRQKWTCYDPPMIVGYNKTYLDVVLTRDDANMRSFECFIAPLCVIDFHVTDFCGEIMVTSPSANRCW